MNEQILSPSFSNVSFPIGTIIPYAGDISPENKKILADKGWLYCNGDQVSRSEYDLLYKAIGDIHGAGDFSKTFNLPDYRGLFLRGADLGVGRDPDASERLPAKEGGRGKDNVGSIQGDSFRRHTHNSTGSTQVEINNSGQWVSSAINNSGSVQTSSASGGNETRPKNASVAWLILAK